MLLLLLSLPAFAVELSAATGVTSFQSYWDAAGARWVEVAAAAPLGGPLTVGGGVRRLFSFPLVQSTAFDAFGRLAAAPALGEGRVRWRPSLALELGLTGGYHVDWAKKGAEESWWLERETEAITSPLYATTAIEPLAVTIGPVSVSAGALGVGSTLPRWGKALRFDLTWARVGFTW